MNTNTLKKFAQNARRNLLQKVEAKLEYVLTHDTAELREKALQIKKLEEEVNAIGKEQLIEKVAYTWFNRLMALRFMDANDYQPSGIRIVSPKESYTLPQLLDEAKQGHFPEEISVDQEKVLGVLDGRLSSGNAQNEAYRYLLIAACNALHKQFPFLFERINDFAELLLPDDLTSEFSIVHDVVEGMSVEDCKEVEIIGWLYQFYISEKKEIIDSKKGRTEKNDIPAVTQLFTPRWIVEYMVQNTLGKLWLQNRPSSRLREHMPYFIESSSLQSDDFLQVESVEEIKLLDQACGSGHILVYAFDLLTKIYKEEGYNPSDIPKLIIEKNLYGFEIDERASQLASLSLLMKARSYHRRLFRKAIQPNVLCFQDVRISTNELEQIKGLTDIEQTDELKHDLQLIEQATNFGSLIQPHTTPSELLQGLQAIEANYSRADVFEKELLNRLKVAISQLQLLSDQFHCVVDNPPYLGVGKMNLILSSFVNKYFPLSKDDLMACFMESGFNSLKKNGYLGMINQHTWMFNTRYEQFRIQIIKSMCFDTMLHLGARAFPEIKGEKVKSTTFTICKSKINGQSRFIKLTEFKSPNSKKEYAKALIKSLDKEYCYSASQSSFNRIPENKFNYWFDERVYQLFEKDSPLSRYSNKRLGLCTGNNDKFLIYWNECVFDEIGFYFNNIKSWKSSKKKYAPHNKGGRFRKWYGNQDILIKYDEQSINELSDSCNKLASKDYYFIPSISWSELSTSIFGVRYYPSGFVFNIKGPSIFVNEDIDHNYILAALNSNSFNYLIQGLSNSMSINGGDVEQVPLILVEAKKEKICNLGELNLQISKGEWDSKETSWNFQRNEVLRHKMKELEETYDLYCQYWKNKFHQLHKNEEELNRQFIEIYGLQEELTPDVPLKDITILKEETNIENGELFFNAREVFAQFVSYSVGCMFGRYSIDKEGLILANQGEILSDYTSKLEKTIENLSFVPDDDAIIPVLDDEWFEDDIVGRFYEFLKVTFGEKDFQKNLTFVEEQLGKDIRKYFVKDFYNDHIKRYKKRPIYWLFSSPKGSFNVLVYLHRYTPDTINNILNNYLREFIQKLKSQKQHFQQVQVSGSTAEQNKATKQIDKLDKMIADCEEYERGILYPLATERIAIDLDDGVLVNYNKMGSAVKTVTGLNDKKAKEKVRKFDWIDITQII